MVQLALKKEVLEKIASDGILFGKVAQSLNIRPRTLSDSLRKNPIKLTQKNTLVVISEHLQLPEDSLIEKTSC